MILFRIHYNIYTDYANRTLTNMNIFCIKIQHTNQFFKPYEKWRNWLISFDLIALPSLSTSYYTAIVLSYHCPFVMDRTDKCVYYGWIDR